MFGQGDGVDEESVARKGQPVPGIEFREVPEPVGEFMTQPRVGQDLPVTVPLAAIHESPDECVLDLHQRSVAQNRGTRE